MIQTVKVPNFKRHNILQETLLTEDTPANSSTLTVENNAGFTAGFGFGGSANMEKTELLQFSGITGNNTITLGSNTKQEHRVFEAIYQLFGSQVQLWRAPNVNGKQPADTEFERVGVPVNMAPDQASTPLTDPDGGADWWYKYTYVNPTTSAETDLASSNAARGAGGNNYVSLEAIRHEAGFDEARYVTAQDIDDKRQAAQDEVNGTLVGVYTVPFTVPVNAHIADITIRLAAGLLLTTQYPSFRSQSNVDGKEKIDSARADLLKLKMKETVLTDQTGTDTSQPGGSSSFSAWPNADTANTSGDQGGAPRIFRMSDIQGYGKRKF